MSDKGGITRDELMQRVGHLLTTAMRDAGFKNTHQVALKLRDPKNARTFSVNLKKMASGNRLPRIDILSEVLGECGYELVIAMRKR